MAITKLNKNVPNGQILDETALNPAYDKIDELVDEVNSKTTEVESARGGEADLDTRLDNIEAAKLNVADFDETHDGQHVNKSTLDNIPNSGSGYLMLNPDGTFTLSTEMGTGDVTGAASAVDGEIVLFSGDTGKIIKTSGLKVADLQGGFTQPLLTPVLNSPSDVVKNTSITYTVSNISTVGAGTRTVVLNVGTSSISNVSASEGVVSIAAGAITVTGVTSASITITYRYTSVGIYSASAMVQAPDDINYSDSNYSLSDSITITPVTPVLNSPADTKANMDVTYNISNIDTDATKVIIDVQSPNFTVISGGTKVGNTVEITAPSGSAANIVIQYTADTTYTVKCHVEVGTFNSLFVTDTIVIDSTTVSRFDIFKDGSCKALYQLDGNVYDTGGNYNATKTGISFAAGKFGMCAYPETTASQILLTAPALKTATIAVSFWLKDDGSDSDNFFVPIMSDSVSQGFSGIGVYGTSNLLRFVGGDHTSISIYDNTYVSDNSWHHIVIQHDNTAGVSQLWRNNVKKGESTGVTNMTYVNDTFEFFRVAELGSGYTSTGIWLDQIRFFNRVLTPAEINELYNES